MQVDNPFHVVGHRVYVGRTPEARQTRFSVYVNNRPLLKRKVPMSRREANEVCALLNKSPRCRKWAATLPKDTRVGVV